MILVAMIAVLLGAAAAFATASVALGRYRQHLADEAVTFRMHFHRGVEPKAVEHLLAGLTGWRTPWWRPWASPTVVFEIRATETGVEHLVLVPEAWAMAFERLAVAHLGEVLLERIRRPASSAVAAASYRLNTNGRQLRLEPVAQSATLLTGLQPLQHGEAVILQWCLVPQGPVPAVTAATTTGPEWAWRGRRPLSNDELAALRVKHGVPMVGATLRIGAHATTTGSANNLVRRAEASLHLSNNPGVHFARARVPQGLVINRLTRRTVPGGAPPMVLNVSELVGPLGFPLGADLPSGMRPPGCRPLLPSAALPDTGTVVGDSDTPGQRRPVAIELQGRYRHLLVTGPTGVGKTTLLAQMVLDDLAKNRAVLVIDPKVDLVDAVLARVPEHRRKDVVVLDPSDADRPVGFNPLRSGSDPELAVEQTVSVMHRLWASSWGVRSDSLLRAALRTVVTDPEGSLADVGPLLTDPTFRARLVPRLTDPALVGFWAAFERLSTAEQGQWVAPPMNKLDAIMSRPALRRVLGQPSPTFDLARALDNRGVVLVPLSAGRLGADAASLFGSFVMGSAWNFIQSRAGSSKRPPLMVHIDEVARIAALPVPLDELLAQARSFNVGVTIATQHLTQLPTELRHAVLANPRSRIAFQPNHDDAQVLARQFGLGLTAEDLQGLDAYQVVAQLYAAGRTQPAATLRTRPIPEPNTSPSGLRRSSAERWGSDGAAVDARLMERMTGGTKPSGPRKPPGRKPRNQP